MFLPLQDYSLLLITESLFPVLITVPNLQDPSPALPEQFRLYTCVHQSALPIRGPTPTLPNPQELYPLD